MSLLHSDDDAALEMANVESGPQSRVKWIKQIKQLRAALLPFAARRATEEDVAVAIKLLNETEGWL